MTFQRLFYCLFNPGTRPYNKTELTVTTLENTMFFLVVPIIPLSPTFISIANALGATLDEIVYGNLNKSSHVSVELIDRLLSDCTDEEIIAIAEMIKTTKKILRKQ